MREHNVAAIGAQRLRKITTEAPADSDVRKPKGATLNGLTRALSVLRALNRTGEATVVEIQRATGIPRPAIYRILETLLTEGYVDKQSGSGTYQLTHLVRQLSDGFRDQAWVEQIAAPVLCELQQALVWPTDLATFFDSAMRIRFSTRPKSPLTIDHAALSMRLPMLSTATGKAWLAFSGAAEREAVIERLAHSTFPEDAVARDRVGVERVLAQTRHNGYGERYRGLIPETGSIAVPIMAGPRVLGCLNITFIASVTTPAEAAKKHLAAMRDAARRIEQRFAGLVAAE